MCLAGTAFAAAQHIQALIALNMPSYVVQGWHGTLLSIAITISSILWNTVLVKKLPLAEGVALSIHFLGFFAFLVVLWVMGPRSNPKDVFTKFEDPMGWGHNNFATLVGILGPIWTLGGADAACHLAEEVKDASWNAPRAMVANAAVGYSLGFIMTVTGFLTLGNDPTALLDTPFGLPWIQIMFNATESTVATSIMTSVVCLMLLFGSINSLTCASRQLFSFARDKGLPCSAWLSHVCHTSPLAIPSADHLCRCRQAGIYPFTRSYSRFSPHQPCVSSSSARPSLSTSSCLSRTSASTFPTSS